MNARTSTLLSAFVAAAPLLLTAFGCAMCCGPYDYHYPVFGGRIQRADPVHGRVGSIFSDPNMAGAGPSADSNHVEPERKEPIPVDRRPAATPPERGTLPRPDDAPARPMMNPEAEPVLPEPARLPSEGRWRPNLRGSGLR